MNLLWDALSAGHDPAAPFLERQDGQVDTYGDLLAHTARLAHALVARGVGPGDRVAAQVEKTPENLYLYLATIRAGAVFLPLNTAYTDAEVDYFVSDAEPRLLVRDEVLAELVEEARGLPAEFETVPREPNDLAAICYTSGTTGRSKGAMLTHANLVSNARTLTQLWRFTADDVLIHALPIYHVHG
ncbi:MAG: AMP-binding protein, partial [Ignavibacteriales bacterium]